MPFAMMEEKHPTVLSRELRLPKGRSFLVLPSTPTYVDGLFQAFTCVTYSRIRTVLLLHCDGLTSNGRIVN